MNKEGFKNDKVRFQGVGGIKVMGEIADEFGKQFQWWHKENDKVEIDCIIVLFSTEHYQVVGTASMIWCFVFIIFARKHRL